MEMTPVKDSVAIKAIGYDPESQTLRIQFHSGSTHQFNGVPEHVHKNFVIADSKGRFFQKQVREKFEQQKVT